MTETYWAKRIFADERKAQRMAGKMLRDSRKAYRQSYKRILREVEGLYAQAVTGEPITRTQLWQYAHWRGLTKELQGFVKDGSEKEESLLTKTLDQVFRSVIGADASIFDGREWRARLNPSAVINTAWSGENYSNRIWNNRSALAVRLREQITQGVLDGKPVGKMAKELESAFAVSYKQAERLARTETSYVFNRASLARYEALGVTRVRWITGINDGKECSICSERSGKVYNLADAPMMPAHPNCRCAWGAVIGEEERTKDGRSDLEEKVKEAANGNVFGLASRDDTREGSDHEPPIFVRNLLDGEDRNEVLLEYEELIRNEPVEHAYVITKGGRIYHCIGTLKSVYPNDLGDELIGADVTHNHPINSEHEYTLSSADVMLFQNFELNRLRGEDERFKYEINRNPEDIDEEPIDWMNELNYRHCDMIRDARSKGFGYRRWEHDKERSR